MGDNDKLWSELVLTQNYQSPVLEIPAPPGSKSQWQDTLFYPFLAFYIPRHSLGPQLSLQNTWTMEKRIKRGLVGRGMHRHVAEFFSFQRLDPGCGTPAYEKKHGTCL